MILNDSQKDILNEWFEKNPYPGTGARDYLAKVIGISEFQVLTWFQNQRTRCRQWEYKCNFGKYQTQVQDKPQFKHEGKEARQIWTNFMRSQIKTLMQAFDKNHFPGFATGEELAKQTAIPEKIVMTWFRNQRAWHQHQRTGGPVDSVAEGPCQTPHARDQLPPKNHSTDPSSFRHLSPHNAVTSKGSLSPAPSPPLTPCAPQASSGGCVSQLPRAKIVPPSQAVQGRENCHIASVCTSHLATGMTLGICATNQGQRQDPSEHTTPERVPSKDPAQPPPDNQQWLDLGQIAPIRGRLATSQHGGKAEREEALCVKRPRVQRQPQCITTPLS
ncbi:double homeobox protein 4 [Erethizon dorsatum]